MSAPAARFDRLARVYRLLEFVAFGRDLERTRFCLLDRLAAARSLLVLGEGDGRCLAQLVRLAPASRIHVIDASAAMLARAADRLDPAARARVVFTHADARHLALERDGYDAAVTLFFLDCFTAAETSAIVSAIAAALQPQSHWLYADFAVPPRGWRRWRAHAWLATLYFFFRWQTGLQPRALPPAEALIRAHNFNLVAQQERQHGLLRTVLLHRP